MLKGSDNISFSITFSNKIQFSPHLIRVKKASMTIMFTAALHQKKKGKGLHIPDKPVSIKNRKGLVLKDLANTMLFFVCLFLF